MRRRLRACPPGNARRSACWPHHRRGRLRRASVPAPCREVPWRGDGHQVPDLPPVPAHPCDLRVRGRTRALRRPGEASGRTGRDGYGIWGVSGVRRRGLPELWLEPPRFVLRSRHGRAARPARPAWVPNSEQDELKYLARARSKRREAWPRGKVAIGHDAVYRQVRWTAVGWLPRPRLAQSTSEDAVSNRDFPYGYRPDRSPEGRSGGFPGPGSSVPSRPGSPDGYAAASQAGGRGIDGLPGYGRGSAQPGSGGRSGGQHSNRSSRGALRGGGRSPGRGGAAASGRSGGVREDVYPPGRGAPGQGGRPGRGGGIRDGSESPWGERGTATRSRGTSRFGTGVRDIRDDLRDRLRRNGVSGDWDEPDGAGPGAGPAAAAATGTGQMARAAASRAARAAGGGTGAGRRY